MNAFIAKTLLSSLPDQLSSLIQSQVRIGNDLFSLVGGTRALEGLKTSFGQMLSQRMTGCCDIPPPCWMPEFLGEVVSLVAGCGGTATLRFHVKNCGLNIQQVTVSKRPADQSHQIAGATFNVTPPKLTLGPLEEGDVSVELKIPDEAKDGRADINVIVHGCKDHYVRWTVRVGSVLKSSTHEVCVSDCPDLVHHWYDHFYCKRPCAYQGWKQLPAGAGLGGGA